jgi:hypothetical protein
MQKKSTHRLILSKETLVDLQSVSAGYTQPHNSKQQPLTQQNTFCYQECWSLGCN